MTDDRRPPGYLAMVALLTVCGLAWVAIFYFIEMAMNWLGAP